MLKYCTAGQDTGHNIIHRMRFACRINRQEYRHALIICNNCSFSSATMVTRTRLSITLHVHCLLRFFFSFFTGITTYTYRDTRRYSVRLWLRVRGISFSAYSARPGCLRKFESHKCSAIMTVHLFNSNEPRYTVFVSSNLTHYYMFMYKTYPHSMTNLC